jgi:acyl-CoA synthetase (AMP-forming)/AMP-acid ligase II
MRPTATQALLHQAQARPKNAAFLFHGEAWTYEKIARQSDSLAHGMMARGVKPGDRVALHMINRPEFIVAYYGDIWAMHETSTRCRVWGSCADQTYPASPRFVVQV